MKILLFIVSIFIFTSCSTQTKAHETDRKYNNSFESVWKQLKSDPYEKLPQREISYFKLSENEGILKNSVRTMNTRADTLEPFEKLAHPNGICFKGIWKIDVKNIYSGYFKKGSEALIIVRASTAMSNTKRGDSRAFGFTGKIFPTLNPKKVNTQASANFFLIDDVGGTDAEHYMDTSLTNEPSISMTFEVLQHMFYALKVSSAFSEVDKNPGIRQLYEISYLGQDSNEKIITPKYLRVEAANSIRVDAADFRDELIIQEGNTLVFKILVASEMLEDKKDWQEIGTIRLDESVASASCDTRLHFHHPKWRDDLDHGFFDTK